MQTQVKRLTPERERVSLFQRGTKPWSLNANTLVQAAESDIRARKFNRDIRAMRANKENYPPGSEIRKQIPPARKFAYLPQHVADHQRASEIIAAAIKGHEEATEAKDAETMMVYESVPRLQEAHAIALAAEQARA